jgi:hypothetical protein
MWFRVFAPTEMMPQPVELQQWLRELGLDLPIDVKGDELGWTTIDAAGLRIERYLTDEDDLRDELDAWAAVVESWGDGPVATSLMQRIISTRQLLTLQGGDDGGTMIEGLAQFLAATTAGVYHADGRGFLSADGTLLLAEG